MLDVGDDIVRGDLDPPDVRAALQNAQQVAQFEQAHGFFVEPALQLWFQHAHAVTSLLSFAAVVRATDLVYALGQTLVPLGVAVWLFHAHPAHFRMARNIALLTVLLALVGYQIYPEAPPRLTTGLIYDHHTFRFLDTMQRMIGDGHLSNVPIAYSAYSAMPSLHMACALIVAAFVFFASRNLVARLLAILYPAVMLFTVVVSANHYLLDAAGAVVVVLVATIVALLLPRALSRLRGGPGSGLRNPFAAGRLVA
ncbi:MAG: phosphatase PAP2 family protein [Chloroflexi bacterium]|nr:phosphatase PAP2 family protein [Chloroflexota bacterium]